MNTSQTQWQAIKRTFLWNLIPILITAMLTSLFYETEDTVLTRQLSDCSTEKDLLENQIKVLNDSIIKLESRLFVFEDDQENLESLNQLIQLATTLLEKLDEVFINAGLSSKIDPVLINKELELLKLNKEEIQTKLRRQPMVDSIYISIRNAFDSQFNELYFSKEERILNLLDSSNDQLQVENVQTIKTELKQADRDKYKLRKEILKLERKITLLQKGTSKECQEAIQMVQKLSTQIVNHKSANELLELELINQLQAEIKNLENQEKEIISIANKKLTESKRKSLLELSKYTKRRKLGKQEELRKRQSQP